MELAYLFWHCRRHAIGDENYRNALLSFHNAIAESLLPGFISSFSRRHSRVPWLESRVEVYEDWYILEDFAALGKLNDSIAHRAQDGTHVPLAGMVDQGLGGVFKLWFNHGDDSELNSVVWFDKPKDKETEDFLSFIDRKAEEAGGVVWRRQLNLGPAKEYVIWLPADKPFLVENSLQFPFNRV